MADKQQNGTIITIFSTASAVGKTLLAINMTAELAFMGYRACLVDLDLQFGDVGNYLHLQSEYTLFDLLNAAREKNDFGDLNIEDFLVPYLYKGVGFSILLAPDKLEQAYNVSTEGVRRAMRELQKRFDYIVIDTTSAFSELNLALMDLSTLITFVGIVDFLPTIKNMKIGYDTMRSIGYDNHKIRLILNRSNSKTHIELDDVEQLLGEKFYYIIPNDFVQAQESIHSGIPLVASKKGTPIRDSIRQLIGRYTNNQAVLSEDDAGLSGWMRKIFK